jgi:hypothetical protein
MRTAHRCSGDMRMVVCQAKKISTGEKAWEKKQRRGQGHLSGRDCFCPALLDSHDGSSLPRQRVARPAHGCRIHSSVLQGLRCGAAWVPLGWGGKWVIGVLVGSQSPC